MAQLVKTVNGLAIASVKTVNGLAIASCKTVNGLDNTSSGYVSEQSQTTVDAQLNVCEDGPDRQRAATEFTASASFTLTKVEMPLTKSGSPTMNIYAVLYSDDGGSDPATVIATSTDSVAAASITNGAYHAFSFAGATITNGTIYWIGLRGDAKHASNFVTWGADQGGTGPTYYGSDAQVWAGTYSGGPHAGAFKLYSGS